MVDWTDPETFWLNVTNALLGLVTIAALALFIGALFIDVWEKVRQRALAWFGGEPHAMVVPGLGATMADGGERKDEARKKQRRGR